MKQSYAQYGWYEIRQDDVEHFVYWAGGTNDDKGEDQLNRNESLGFDPRCLPVGTRIHIELPTDDEGFSVWPEITLVAMPADYEHPDNIPLFLMGETVTTPLDETGVIDEIRPGYYNREDDWRDIPMYHVKSKKPGSPTEWWFGYQLKNRND